jgi:hypothetical protein
MGISCFFRMEFDYLMFVWTSWNISVIKMTGYKLDIWGSIPDRGQASYSD